MSTTTQFRLYFLTAFIILFCAMITAQVKIKERVEISPGKLLKGTTDENALSITISGLNPNDFALQGGSFINPYNQIYDDLIFIPRIGGVIKTAWDILYSYNGFEIQNGLMPWEDRLLVFGPDGKVRYKFNVGEFWDEDGKWIAYYFDQERYWYDRKMDSLCQAQVPEHHPDTTKWGWILNLNLEIPVTAWEPLRFRLFYGLDEITAAPSMMFVTTGTNYPSEFTGGGGNMTFPCTGNICKPMFGDIFNMCFYIDSNKVGNTPIVYPDQAEFFLPDSGMYRVIIGGVLSNVNGTLSIIDTTSHVLITDIRSHQGDTILVGPYNEGTTIKFDLSGMAQGQGYTDYNGGAVVFESWTDYDFEDAKIWFEYAAGRPDHLELWSTSETIYYGDTLDVDIVPCDKDSLFSPLGPDCYYEFSVELTGETSKYVELICDDVGSTLVEHIPSENRRGLGVRLAANKLEPDSVVDLTFHLTAIDLQSGGGAASVIPTTTQPTKMAKLSKDMHIKMKSGDTSIKNVVDRKISESIASKTKFGQKKEDRLNSKPVIYRKKKIGHLISRQGSSLTYQTSKLIQVKDASTNQIRFSITDGEGNNIIVQNDWYIGERKFEILLGETKYFKAIKNPDPKYPNNLIIEEVTTFDKTGEPSNDGAEDVNFDVSQGTVMGVYWESKWPLWTNEGLETKTLKTGIVRVVGRYWQEGSKDKVHLWAQLKSDPNVAGYIIIYVKKPTKLGDTHTTVTDVLGNQNINLDDVIIKYAGKNGIPPQIIKGQIENESAFKPAYRWEPLVDATNQLGKFFVSGFSYTITRNPNSEGNPPIPTDHSNAQPNYPHGTYETIWDRFYERSKTLNPSAGSNNYPARSPVDNRPLWYENAVNGWEEKFFTTLISEMASSIWLFFPYDQIVEARAMANAWLKKEYKMDKVAQTRASASYGFLQMTYPTAVGKDVGYPKDFFGVGNNLPEYINLTQTNFDLCIPFLSKKLKQEIKDEKDPSNAEGNWKLGFEETLRIALNMYNGKTSMTIDTKKGIYYSRYTWRYADPILTSSLRYKPSLNK